MCESFIVHGWLVYSGEYPQLAKTSDPKDQKIDVRLVYHPLRRETTMTEYFVKAVFYTSQLHQLMLDGKDELDEAEDIRCHFDQFWYKMSPEEIKQAQLFSAKLFEYFPEEK